MSDFLSGTVTSKDWMAVGGILGAAALVAVGFYFAVNRSQQNERLQVISNDNQVFADLTKARERQEGIEALRMETDSIQRLVTEFEERLPSRREIPMLLKEFEAMAAEEDIDVELSPLARDRDARKEIIPYRIVARGSFHQVASFINRLERFKRYLKISNLEVGPTKDGVTRAEFTLNTYRFLKS
ncbi:MAG: type 4a pilus biogenesis protein PilO [Candidatus Hydrogenedentes bacterium]|nr:type 4a pilus biogenesis protein PilO [Candidatus Hydrogenedentota bacterium]